MSFTHKSYPLAVPYIHRTQDYEIFKIQTAVDSPGRVLIYNQDRSVMQEFHSSDMVAELGLKFDMPPQGGKIFVYGIIKDQHLKIGDRAPWQDW